MKVACRTALTIASILAIGVFIPIHLEDAHADDVRQNEWHLTTLNVEGAHKISNGSGVVVGLLDTGVDAKHRDLNDSVLPGLDLIGPTNGSQDLDGHGTGMASLIAGHGSNGTGILGLAPAAKILPVRISSDAGGDGNSPYRDGGFTWAAQHGASVICASFATHDTPGLRADVQAAIDAGVVIVAAAGNIPTTKTVAYPAGLPGVVAVDGVGSDGVHDQNAASGDSVLISAPSVHIESAFKHNSYAVSTGTSDAAAIVAGVAALIRSKYPTMSAAEVIHRLTATATDKGPPGRDPDYGYGIVNPVAALTANIPPLTPTATPPTHQPPTAQATPTKTTETNPETLALLGLALLAVAAAGLSIAVTRNRRRQ